MCVFQIWNTVFSKSISLENCFGLRLSATIIYQLLEIYFIYYQKIRLRPKIGDNKVTQPICVLVGAGEGLGQALAAKFASNGFGLALISRSIDGSAAAAKAAKAYTSKVKFFQADAKKPKTIEVAVGQASSQMGEIEVLIYNCRDNFNAFAPLDMTYDALMNNYKVEVVGAFAAAKSVLPTMIQRSRGTIFFSSATAAFRGSATHPLYSIGKFGVRALSQSLAKAYGKKGVHVVHVRLDCDLNVPYVRNLHKSKIDGIDLADPQAVADCYWLTYQQSRGAWSNEIEIRPHTEKWTF